MSPAHHAHLILAAALLPIACKPIGATTKGAATSGQAVTPSPTATAWTLRTTGVAPIARYGYAMARDTVRNETIVYGGIVAAGEPDETWVWNGSQWIRRGLGGGPPASYDPGPKRYAGMVFDAARGVAVLFGGDTGSGLSNETWEWDGAAWVNRTTSLTTSPSPRHRFGMIYDPNRRVTILFGGRFANGSATNEIWEYNGSAWTSRPADFVAPRSDHAMAYDTVRRHIVIFGGEQDGLLMNDTWTYDGSLMREQAVVTTSAAPAPRRHPALGFSPCAGRVVLFGGETTGERALDDSWEWDGARWTETTAFSSLRPVYRHSMSFVLDAPAGATSLLLFGGRTRNPPTTGSSSFSQETWTLGCEQP